MSSLLFGNGTNIVHWKSNCTTRGTFDILSTCIITLVLCVWTAVHLNVPPPGSVWRPKVRKTAWLVLALLAPELVAFTAWLVFIHMIRCPHLRTCEPESTFANSKLTRNRNQRQEALYAMRAVNNAYGLPNPLSWNQKVSATIGKAATRLTRRKPLQQGLAPVSPKNQSGRYD